MRKGDHNEDIDFCGGSSLGGDFIHGLWDVFNVYGHRATGAPFRAGYTDFVAGNPHPGSVYPSNSALESD